jgi:hypothetical protein
MQRSGFQPRATPTRLPGQATAATTPAVASESSTSPPW